MSYGPYLNEDIIIILWFELHPVLLPEALNYKSATNYKSSAA